MRKIMCMPIKDLDELHQAVAQWYQRRYQVNLNPDREITSLLGSQEGLAHICLSIVDPGDTVLVPDPCYPFSETVPGSPEQGWFICR